MLGPRAETPESVAVCHRFSRHRSTVQIVRILLDSPTPSVLTGYSTLVMRCANFVLTSHSSTTDECPAGTNRAEAVARSVIAVAQMQQAIERRIHSPGGSFCEAGGVTSPVAGGDTDR